jgi:hypothetical protein
MFSRVLKMFLSLLINHLIANIIQDNIELEPPGLGLDGSQTIIKSDNDIFIHAQ